MWVHLLVKGKAEDGENPVIYGFEECNKLGRAPRGEPELASACIMRWLDHFEQCDSGDPVQAWEMGAIRICFTVGTLF